MKYFYILLIRFLLIVLGILIGFLLYTYLVRPVLVNNCFLETDNCVKISYWSYKNSVLAQIQPEGYWVWFNGNKAYVYLPETDNKICDSEEFVPAYSVSATTEWQKPDAVVCIMNKERILKFYDANGVKSRTLYAKAKIKPVTFGQIPNPPQFSYLDVLNLLASKNIINLENI